MQYYSLLHVYLVIVIDNNCIITCDTELIKLKYRHQVGPLNAKTRIQVVQTRLLPETLLLELMDPIVRWLLPRCTMARL